MDDKQRHAYTNYLTIMAFVVCNLPGYSQVPQTVGSAINTPASLNRALSSRYSQMRGAAVAQWLRRCTTNRKVAGSIPDGVTGI